VTLDSVINAIIGPIIIIAIAVLIYTKAKAPIDKFFAWVGSKIRGDDREEKYEGSYEIDYQPVGTYDWNKNDA